MRSCPCLAARSFCSAAAWAIYGAALALRSEPAEVLPILAGRPLPALARSWRWRPQPSATLLSFFLASGLRALESGLWALGSQLWAWGCELWTPGTERCPLDAGLWPLASGILALRPELWALGSTLWTPGTGRWALRISAVRVPLSHSFVGLGVLQFLFSHAPRSHRGPADFGLF